VFWGDVILTIISHVKRSARSLILWQLCQTMLHSVSKSLQFPKSDYTSRSYSIFTKHQLNLRQSFQRRFCKQVFNFASQVFSQNCCNSNLCRANLIWKEFSQLKLVRQNRSRPKKVWGLPRIRDFRTQDFVTQPRVQKTPLVPVYPIGSFLVLISSLISRNSDSGESSYLCWPKVWGFRFLADKLRIKVLRIA